MADELWRWSLCTARKLSLDALVKPEAPDPLPEVQRVWDISRGRRSENPSPTAGRSNVKPIFASGGKTFWRKHFDVSEQRWQINETGVLNYLKTVDRDGQHGVRGHVCGIREVKTFGQGTSLEILETWDGGPNLDSWRAFTPCGAVQGLALPLFVQPTFVAAIARQALIGLDKLAQFSVVHNDLKANNICLALPTHFKRRNGVWRGHWDLRHLPLRILDFEGAFDSTRNRLVQSPNNGWVSPFARECHSAAGAAALAGDDDLAIQNLLAGIDWGADLWSLGQMLVEWKQSALDFFLQWIDAASLEWGDGSATCDCISAVFMTQAEQWRALQELADQLKAADRPISEAGKSNLRTRTNRPHDVLWRQLERDFPALSPGAKPSPLALSLIDPHKPLSFRPARSWGVLAHAWLGRAGTSVRRHAGAGLVGTAALGVGATVWASADSASRWAGESSARIAASAAEAWRTEGGFYRVSTQWLAKLPAGREGVQRSVSAEPAWVEPPANASDAAKAAYAVESRQRSIRALAQWVLAEGDTAQPDSRALIERVLNKLYLAQNRLEQMSQGTPVEADFATDLIDAERPLARLSSQGSKWPLATMMQLRLSACYANGVGASAIPRLVKKLAAVPKDAPSASVYRNYAVEVQKRLDRGVSPCLGHNVDAPVSS